MNTPSATPKYLAKSALYWPVFLAWMVLPALILLLPRSFHGNDDTIMVETLRGGHPAPFLGNGFSLALAWIYTHVSENIPWYGLLLYLISCGGAHAGLRLVQIFGTGSGLVRKIWTGIAAFWLLAVFWAFSLHLTYTMAGITACGLGVIAFAVECRNQSLTWRKGLAYGLLIAAGYQLRPEGTMAVAATLGLPGLAFLLWFLFCKRQEYAVAFLAVAAPVALAVAAERIGPSFFSKEEVTYREYNRVRGAIQGFDKYRQLSLRNPEGLKQAGWSANAAGAFEGFINFDEDEFSIEKIRKLLPLAMPVANPEDSPFVLAKNMARQGVKMSAYAWPLLVGALLSACLMRGRRRRNWLGLAAILFHMACILVLLAVLAYAMRVVPRICLPIMLTAAMTALALGWWIMGDNWLGMAIIRRDVSTAKPKPPALWGNRIRAAAAGLLCLVLLAFAGLEWLDLEHINHPGLWQQKGATLAGRIRQYAPQLADKVIVEYACSNGFSNGVDPLDADPMPFRMVYLEWSPPSPFFYDNLRAADIARGADILHAGYTRPDVFFLMDTPYIAQFDAYAQHVAHKPVHFAPAMDIGWEVGTGLYHLVDGPSHRFKLDGCVPGTIFKIGDIRARPAAPAPQPAPSPFHFGPVK